MEAVLRSLLEPSGRAASFSGAKLKAFVDIFAEGEGSERFDGNRLKWPSSGILELTGRGWQLESAGAARWADGRPREQISLEDGGTRCGLS
mmetsp:Transcript_46680/g.107899  ORF Transcript_46680/g.107899 Transcript_46680/m.107899 type:complete len:91 (-) Transcript_46680:57-329(-)